MEKMKICYLANSRFPSERAHMTQIVAMCNAFTLKGNDVSLLVTDRKTDITDTPEVFFGVPIHFSVIRIPVPDIAGISSKIPRVFRPFFFTIQRFVFAYRASRRTSSFDLVYGRDEWILWLVSLFSKVRIVWESHEARYSIAGKALIKNGVPIVAISEGIRDFYVKQGVNQKILVAHDAVDERFFAPHVSTEHARRVLHIATQKPVVMYIGGLEEWKGVEILCKAGEGQSVFEVYVIGGKEKEIALLRQKYPSVHFLGHRAYRDLPITQQAADILVIPNSAKDAVSSEYTSPLKLFTHMTSKKILVTSRVPSIMNILTTDDVFFFEPDIHESLQKIIMEALAQSEEGIKRATHAHEKSFQYTWNSRAERIISFIAEHDFTKQSGRARAVTFDTSCE